MSGQLLNIRRRRKSCVGRTGLQGRLIGRQLREVAGLDRDARAGPGCGDQRRSDRRDGVACFETRPAGERALIAALRWRIVKQQVVSADQLRDARMAAIDDRWPPTSRRRGVPRHCAERAVR
jgi:hypothetical protein